MKKKLFSILPKFITTHKYGDKIAHAFYGTLVFVTLSTILGSSASLFITWVMAAGVEVYDMKTHKGDMKDFVATVIVPILLYIIIN